jgi:CBS domain containing-hemolysin-like protein
MIWQILLAFFLVFLNGFFVAAEFAIVKVRESQIELKARKGSKLAKLAKKITQNLDTYLSATQLGITLASLGLGWIGEPVVAVIINKIMLFFNFSMSPETVHSISLPIAFVTITIMHIVFGELAPKSLAIQRSEKVALITSGPLMTFYYIFSPFIWLLNSFANLILRIAGFSPVKEMDQLHSSDEIRYILEESKKSGLIEVAEHDLINNIFEFSDKDVKQVMVPRGKVVAIETGMNFDEIVQMFINKGYTRLPVYDKRIDNIVGVIYSKDLLPVLIGLKKGNPEDFMRKAYFVQEEELLNNVLNKLLANRIHIAMVLDSFGGLAGMVTLEDILEEIVGEIQDEYDEEKPLVEKINENEFRVAATTVINDVNEYLPVPMPESDDYETVAGLITSAVGRIPRKNEIIEIDDYIIKILNRSDRIIETVKLVKKLQDDNNNEK